MQIADQPAGLQAEPLHSPEKSSAMRKGTMHTPNFLACSAAAAAAASAFFMRRRTVALSSGRTMSLAADADDTEMRGRGQELFFIHTSDLTEMTSKTSITST